MTNRITTTSKEADKGNVAEEGATGGAAGGLAAAMSRSSSSNTVVGRVREKPKRSPLKEGFDGKAMMGGVEVQGGKSREGI